MALLPYIDSLDGLADLIKAEYKEYQGEDASMKGKFVLDVTQSNGWALENVQGLRNALGSEKEQRRRANESLGKFVGKDGSPLDPADIISKLERLDGLDSGKIKGEDLTERIRAAQEAEANKWKVKLEEVTGAAKKLETKYSQTVMENAAVTAITKHRGKVRALLPHVLSAAELRDTDGRPELVILGQDGNPRLSTKAGSTGNMTIDEFVGTILRNDEDFSGSFDGTGASGGGSSGGSRSVHSSRISADLPPSEQMRLARQGKSA